MALNNFSKEQFAQLVAESSGLANSMSELELKYKRGSSAREKRVRFISLKALRRYWRRCEVFEVLFNESSYDIDLRTGKLKSNEVESL